MFFVYSLILRDMTTACELIGLDPYLGFFHVIDYGRPSMALDLMEEFRPFADRLALTLINRAQIGSGDFAEREGGAVLLDGDARKTVVVAYQERKQEEMTHPLLAQPLALGLLPLIQARLLARAIRGETEGYLPFLTR